MFGKIHLWIHPVQGFFLLGVFFIIASISLAVISLFRFFTSSWFSFGRLYVYRNLSISLRLLWNFWRIVVHSIFLQSFLLCDVSCYFSFGSDFVYLGSLSLSVSLFLSLFQSLFKVSSIWFIFSKNQLLVSLIFLYCVLVSISFIGKTVMMFKRNTHFLKLKCGCRSNVLFLRNVLLFQFKHSCVHT